MLVPLSLMSHPILALLANAYLIAFNELRECAPVSAADSLAASLASNLSSVTAALVAYYKRYSSSYDQVPFDSYLSFYVSPLSLSLSLTLTLLTPYLTHTHMDICKYILSLNLHMNICPSHPLISTARPGPV